MIFGIAALDNRDMSTTFVPARRTSNRKSSSYCRFIEEVAA